MTIANVSAQAYNRISSGSQINKAADNAAGLSITQGMTSEIKGMEKNVSNIGTMSDLASTAESALGNISDNLGRIRELAVQASNGILTKSDRSAIQSEIGQLMKGITDVAKNTEFNTVKLLDGSFANKNTAMQPDGSGRQISISSATLDNLGIAGFDVTGDFNVADIDKAMEKVTTSRSNLGSASNAFGHAISSTSNTMANLTGAKSTIQDTDIALEISNLKKEKILQQYQMFANQSKADRQRTELGVIQDFKV